MKRHKKTDVPNTVHVQQNCKVDLWEILSDLGMRGECSELKVIDRSCWPWESPVFILSSTHFSLKDITNSHIYSPYLESPRQTAVYISSSFNLVNQGVLLWLLTGIRVKGYLQIRNDSNTGLPPKAHLSMSESSQELGSCRTLPSPRQMDRLQSVITRQLSWLLLPLGYLASLRAVFWARLLWEPSLQAVQSENDFQ